MGPSTGANKAVSPLGLTEQEKEDLAATTAMLDTMLEKKYIRPEGPYILTIPQDTEQVYQHRSHLSAAQWRFNAPFHSDEPEEKQYQTYTYYDPSRSMYRQHNNDYSTPTMTPKLVQQTPNNTIKKKMSLADYKKAKTAPAAETPTADTKTVTKNPLERLKQLDNDPKPLPLATPTKAIEQDTKRKRDAIDDGYESGEISSPASKRSRQDAQPDSENPFTQEMSLPKLSPPHSKSDSLPTQEMELPKLSPPRSRADSIPGRLSPTIPRRINVALAKRRHTASAPNGDVTPPPATSKTKSPAPKNGFKTSDLSQASADGSLVVKLKVNSDKVANTTAQKRKRDDDDTQSKGVARPLKKPTLSPRPQTQSPETTRTGTPKAQSTAMSRLQSYDGHTPVDIASPRTNGHVDKTPSKTKTEEQRVWDAECRRLDPIARKLKHESQNLYKEKPAKLEIAATKALESFIGYMLVFHSADLANAAAEPRLSPSYSQWAGLTGLFSYVRNRCTDMPKLAGIAAMLGLTYSSHVLELIENTPQNHEKDALEFSRLARRSAKEMETNLGVAVLMKSFPESWRARSKTPITDDKCTPKDLLKGEYTLPAGLHTSPVQAARAAYALLKEWLAASNLQYDTRI